MEEPTTHECQAAAPAPAPQPAARRKRWPTTPDECIHKLFEPWGGSKHGAWIRERHDIREAYDAAAKAVRAANQPEDRWAEHSAWATPYELVGKLLDERYREQTPFWLRACEVFSYPAYAIALVTAGPILFCGIVLPRWWSAAFCATAPEPEAAPPPVTTAVSDDASKHPTKCTASSTGGSDDGDTQSDTGSDGATLTSSDGGSDGGGGTAAPAPLQAEGLLAEGRVGTVGQAQEGLRWRLNAGMHSAL